jgi:hypothetical protein
VIIYSNSGVTSSLQLAADLIENKSPDNRGLFSVLADANHPLRENDRRNSKNPGDPLKQFSTLQPLFKDTGLKPSQVLFVDDRDDHALKKQVAEGLTYIVVTPYITHPTTEERERLFYMAFDALHSQDLLNNEEYLESPFFRRQLHDGTRINNFMDVFLWIWKAMIEKPENNGGSEWEDDTAALTTRMQEYLEKF